MLNFLIGLLLGGCIAGVILCCVQVNRVSKYQQKIYRLRKKLNHRD